MELGVGCSLDLISLSGREFDVVDTVTIYSKCYSQLENLLHQAYILYN